MPDRYPPTWPRLEIDEAISEVARLQEMAPDEAASLVSTNVEGHRFYPTAPSRVNKAQLDDIRATIIDLASRHGFPNERNRRAQPTFDQELAVLAADTFPMLPVEASDEEVWAFLTLRVVPDVAVWRWPLEDPVEVEEGTEKRFRVTSTLERLIGHRRGMLKQAWWRSFLLGPEACTQLDEDNFIQMTDRISLTGDRRLSRALVATHLEFRNRAEYPARAGLRRAMVLIGRLLGRLAIDALPDDVLAVSIRRCFEQALEDTKPDGPVDAADTVVSRSDRAESEEPQVTGSAIDRFLELAAAYTELLEPHLYIPTPQDAVNLTLAAQDYARQLGDDIIAVRISEDLSSLVDEWLMLDDDERAVVHAALAYFLDAEDAKADASDEGLIDDDEVVDAAFTAIGRTREPG